VPLTGRPWRSLLLFMMSMLTTELEWLRKLAGISKQKTKEEKRRYQNNYIFFKTLFTSAHTHQLWRPELSDSPYTSLACDDLFFYRNILFSCGRLSWLNCQLLSALFYSIFTYLLTYYRRCHWKRVRLIRSRLIVTFYFESNCSSMTLDGRNNPPVVPGDDRITPKGHCSVAAAIKR